jgi:hypothetical protein
VISIGRLKFSKRFDRLEEGIISSFHSRREFEIETSRCRDFYGISFAMSFEKSFDYFSGGVSAGGFQVWGFLEVMKI